MVTEQQPILTATAVQDLMKKCLAGERVNAGLIVPALIRSFVFDRGLIERHKKDIHTLLMELDPTFYKSVGGGWTFLYMPQDKHGRQWGQQLEAEELLALGIAAGLAEIIVPKEMWPEFPGGVPYIAVDNTVVLD